MQDKEKLNLNRLEANSKRKNIIYRWILYFILGIFVFYYLCSIVFEGPGKYNLDTLFFKK